MKVRAHQAAQSRVQFFGEWCYSVNVRKVVRDMSGETEICLVEVESMFCMLWG